MSGTTGREPRRDRRLRSSGWRISTATGSVAGWANDAQRPARADGQQRFQQWLGLTDDQAAQLKELRAKNADAWRQVGTALRQAQQDLRQAAMGLRGGDLAFKRMSPPLYHHGWYPLWEAAAECHFPISFHSTGFKGLRAPDTPEMEKAFMTQWRLVRSALFQLDTMEVLVSLLASGACEKYPDLNFVLGESGVTWLPYVFDRLDTEYNDRARSLGFSMKPSDYFKRQGYVTYQQDQYLEPIVPLIGEDNIIWGADYPHPDCVWPDSRRYLDKNLAGFPERVRRKITCENVTRLYRL
ncbi:MAG: hypothetical protein DMD81_05905 [Candidatus Rokuibacteriota bacterium]|nr:MAG: hypothetical protein DMD81_05905 [Candidatus Rokubacteria bacterium]